MGVVGAGGITGVGDQRATPTFRFSSTKVLAAFASFRCTYWVHAAGSTKGLGPLGLRFASSCARSKTPPFGYGIQLWIIT
jgi:hypothetical protein